MASRVTARPALSWQVGWLEQKPAGWLLLGCVSQSIWQQADSQTRAVWREDRSLWETMQGSRSKVLKAGKQLCEGAWTGLRNPSFLAQYCQVPVV